MKAIKFNQKKRGPKGEGRATVYKPVQLPVDLIDELKLYKDMYGIALAEEEDEYGNPIPVHVSFEQMFRRWIEIVGRYDSDIRKDVEAAKKYRLEHPMPETFPVDPVDCDVWDLRYLVERDGEEIYLQPDRDLIFSADVNGKKVGLEQFINEEWEFMNDAAIEINLEQAKAIRDKIFQHNKRISK